MKNFCIIHILLLILCMLVYQCTSAQDFIVTSKGDTIRGAVKLLTYGKERNVQVAPEGKKRMTYSVVETKHVHYKNEDYYPLKNSTGYNFMKLLKKGYLSLYAYQLENQTSYDGLLLSKMDGSFLEVPNLGFKKQIARYLEDCDDVATRIDDGTLGKKDLTDIIDQYNTCIDKKSERFMAGLKTAPSRSAWDTLEEKLKTHADFEGKSAALEMVAEVRNKLAHGEKVPNFMLDGLRNALASQKDLTPVLENALTSLP